MVSKPNDPDSGACPLSWAGGDGGGNALTACHRLWADPTSLTVGQSGGRELIAQYNTRIRLVPSDGSRAAELNTRCRDGRPRYGRATAAHALGVRRPSASSLRKGETYAKLAGGFGIRLATVFR